MPEIETWGNLPPGVRHHLIARMRERLIGIADLNHLRLLLRGQAAKGKSV